MEANYAYSRRLLDVCLARRIPLIYASSASVYGAGPLFREDPACESPLNPYAYSKLLFDQRVRRVLPDARSQVVGLRYFNVYGPREAHKGEMASVAYKLHRELEAGDRVRLFEGSAGYAAGEQRRDFVWVGDVVALNLWFLDHPDRSGVFNAGTGRAQTFNDVARAVIAWHGRGRIEYAPFPAGLRDAYQSYTQADLSALRAVGYTAAFLSVEEGVPRYLDWLAGKSR
jgi:ADP-L-glycero-D-manno-heptose 6-epimerase